MTSASRAIPAIFAAFALAFLAEPAWAQRLPTGGDPFAGVPEADDDQMSEIGGETPSIFAARTSALTSPGDCGTGPQCGESAKNSIGFQVIDQGAGVRSVKVKVTAINRQTTTIGRAVLNTSGGYNSATGGNSTAGGN